MAKKKLSKKAMRSALARAVTVVPTRTLTKKAATKKPTKKKRAKKKPAKKRPVRKLTSRRGIRGLERRAAVAEARDRKAALALIADIGQRKQRIARDFYAVGESLKKLSDPRLYRAAGYERFDALVKGEKLMSKALAYKLMAIVEAYPAAAARKLGMAKAYALFAYTEATPAEDLAPQLAEANPRIGEHRLDTMSVRDLLDAARRARAATSGRARSEPEREARRVAKRVQKTLRAKGAKSAKARARRHGAGWRIRVDLGVDEASVFD